MGLGKEGRTSLALGLLQTPVNTKEEMNKLAALIRSFGFEYGFDEPEIRYRAYEIMLGITKKKTANAKLLLEHSSKLRLLRKPHKGQPNQCGSDHL